MCVVALAWQVHPDWPLILIGNRDELHTRPSAALAAWDDGSGIVAGRDLLAGGTWLGVHPGDGRVVVVTNVRGALPDPAKASRGQLVVDMLRGAGRPTEADLDHFNAFNLLAIERNGAQMLTNRPRPEITRLAPGIHALANEAADMLCPRADRLGAALRVALGACTAPETLLDMLSAEDDPALFLRGDVYGTRASTLIAVASDGAVHLVERRYEKGGRPAGTTALHFQSDALRIG